jgi:dihydrofolate synthase/folylpolyglutamate synthase
VIGILSDKNISEMLSLVVPLADTVIVTKSQNIRASDPTTLISCIQNMGLEKDILQFEAVPEALNHAKKLAKKQDLICITGSLFTVGEARACLLTECLKSF